MQGSSRKESDDEKALIGSLVEDRFSDEETEYVCGFSAGFSYRERSKSPLGCPQRLD